MQAARYLVVLLFPFLTLALTVGGCRARTERSPVSVPVENHPAARVVRPTSRTAALVYYQTPDGRYLLPLSVPINAGADALRVALEQLLAGPPTPFASPTFPEGLKLARLERTPRGLEIDLAPAPRDLTPEQLAKGIESLLLTVAATEGPTKVWLTAEGRPLQDASGKVIPLPLEGPPRVNPLEKENSSTRWIRVYYGDANGMFLVPVDMSAPQGLSTVGLAELAVRYLLDGPPPDSGLTRTVWPGTRLRAISLEAGILTVDFSAEVTGYGGGSTAETLLLSSLLFTLTDIPGIQKVQMLIEGQKRDFLPEGSAILNPLERPANLNYLGEI